MYGINNTKYVQLKPVTVCCGRVVKAFALYSGGRGPV
jgi:hypothetical protein